MGAEAEKKNQIARGRGDARRREPRRCSTCGWGRNFAAAGGSENGFRPVGAEESLLNWSHRIRDFVDCPQTQGGTRGASGGGVRKRAFFLANRCVYLGPKGWIDGSEKGCERSYSFFLIQTKQTCGDRSRWCACRLITAGRGGLKEPNAKRRELECASLH